MAADQGLEPQLTAPEAVVLPLDESAISLQNTLNLAFIQAIPLDFYLREDFIFGTFTERFIDSLVSFGDCFDVLREALINSVNNG